MCSLLLLFCGDRVVVRVNEGDCGLKSSFERLLVQLHEGRLRLAVD
jgi:hypothetical protein